MNAPFLIATLLTLLVMIAMVTDLASYRIPNWVNGALLLLYPVAYVVLPDGTFAWRDGLIAFGVVFAIGYIIFMFKIMGGGDIKMLSVLALWIGFNHSLADFFIVVGLLGGGLTLLLLFLRKLAPYIMVKLTDGKGSIPRVLSYHEPLPYGVAIGIAFLWMLWKGGLPFFTI